MAEMKAVARLAWVPSLSRVAGVLVAAAFGLALGGLLATLLAVHFFGYRIVTVQSGSMEPALSRGDVIFSRPVNINDVKVGQIILFDEGRDIHFIAAHRVVGFINLHTNITDSATGNVTTEDSKLLQTKGDANATQDANAVDASRLRGRVWFTIPGAGLVLDHIPLQMALFGVAGLAAACWLTLELYQRLGRRKRDPGPPAI
jgi:signal peptidase I